ncbi:hypothetical protein HX052_07305 [Myroides marinus]|uniref:hypothetical protein n=1 Tax=Myroides marinus TaxID=703342 RepID=UPI002578C541|nr:hypothetical protein [Myroides marinus]MDM1346260.1 hypothetical protein [Myroides marinus]MDM1353858.1 hypothetical protein [Myroides marinus]MDM1361185.1 hypothetical protein [Myroides marinus]MDM1368205.1 hypothetical protein [Myroides marinus]MDM1372114.1 hypothetical protein [Myroides marinus]
MKRILIIAPLFLLLMNCGSSHTATNAKKGKTKTITVLDYAIEKSHLLVTEKVIDPKNKNKTKENTTTEIEQRQFLFTYDDAGQLVNTYSCDILNDKKTNPSTLTVHLNAKKQITGLSLDENENKLKVSYKDNFVHQISHYESEFKELVVNTFTYNKNKLPGKTQLGNASKPSQVIDLSFSYDEKLNVVESTYDNEVMTLAYDDKKYLLAGQPYYYNPFYYLSIDWLTFTNYNPQNNITRSEDNEFITTVDYTYNEKDLPITATVTKTSKVNKQDSRVTSEHEFHYKEIEIPIKK